MLIPMSWLKKYVPVSLSAKEVAHRLTMAGTEIGGIEEIGANWDRDKILVGRVLKVDRHPNADRLTLPTVDLGNGETATVVCGGPNLAQGQKIAFAREGATLFNTRSGQIAPLKAARIRGVVSAGMVCSEKELGLGEDHTGILVLDDDAPVGMPLVDYMGDAILDAEITPNRPDCLSILGIAHEVAALTGERVTEPDLDYPEHGISIKEQVRIEIADPDLCHRYAASMTTGVKVGPSPRWLQDALVKAGLRPINNIVDITNYVMLEYGQPLHAFDLDKIKDRTVIVRAARPGERFVPLDGEERTLQPPNLSIADSHDTIALAGVMGGADTGVQDGATSILLESANFSPRNTRNTARALNMSTDASYRFERGIRADLVPRALRHATKLILEVAGGKAAKGIIDLYPGRKEPSVVILSSKKIKQVLGMGFPIDRAESVFTSLGFERIEPDAENDTLTMEVPYWRSDIAIEEDLIEELARVVGYDDIPITMLSSPVPHHEPRPQREMRERIRDALTAAGMQETISYSATDRKTLEGIGAIGDGPKPLVLANPISSKAKYMRTSLRGSVLQTLASNRRVSQGEGLRLFEIGRVYLAKEEARERVLPDEREVLVGVLSGPRFPTSWVAPQSRMDFFDAKGVLESVFRDLGMTASYEPSTDSIMHPGKTARVLCDGRSVGILGETHPRVLERFDLGQGPVAMMELDLETLYEAMKGSAGVYTATSRFPESERDLALIVDATVPSARIQMIIDRHKLVKRSSPFDVYSGPGIPAGKKSIAYRITFQSDRSTLTSDLVDKAQGDILRQLRRELRAELRA